MNGLLSLVTWLPLLGAIILLLFPKNSAATARTVAIAFSVLTLAASVFVLTSFAGNSFHFQLVEKFKWIPSLGITYSLGVDGISIWLVLLTALMTVVAVAMSSYIDRHVHAFMALVLMLESFMIGAFLSLDLILFFTFFELTLFPMYFLITVWGGERRFYAGAKFFIYTFAGSIFMLVGMIALALRMPGGISFDIVKIQQSVALGQLWQGDKWIETLVFWSFAIAFLVKAPSFPFHTWMPDAYGESPTAVPVLSSVMVKLGTFGILRFCLPLFPDVIGDQIPILMGLAVVGIIYGAILAAVQPDMRRLLAYSSVSHMGFILLGIFSLTHEGLVGAAFQQLNHGVVAGGLMLLVALLWERRKTNLLSEYGGLKSQMPIFATLFLLMMLASVGLPGTNGFIGEFLALLGSFETASASAFGINYFYPGLAGLGVVLAAVYLLYLYQQLFYGNVDHPANRRLKDLKPWEIGVTCLLLIFVFWGGIYPSSFLKPMEASLQATRLMATHEAGQRPQWADESQRIDLAESGPNVGALEGASNGGGPVVLAPGDLHFVFARQHALVPGSTP